MSAWTRSTNSVARCCRRYDNHPKGRSMAHPHPPLDQLSADFDPLAAETFTSAHAQYAEMRESCPVAHSTAWNGFWALMRYEDVVSVLKDDKTFTTTVQN